LRMNIGESLLRAGAADATGSRAAQTGQLAGEGCAQERESGRESESLSFETGGGQYRKQRLGCMKQRVGYHVALQLGQRLLDFGVFRQVCVCVYVCFARACVRVI
jgi:hypothetical protein